MFTRIVTLWGGEEVSIRPHQELVLFSPVVLLCDGEDTRSTSTGVHIIHPLPVFQSASSVSDGLWNVLPDKI